MRDAGETVLRRKLTVRAAGRKVVLAKGYWESERHVLLKALVFGRYAESYPDLSVERDIGHRYRPDLSAMAPDGHPIFWAECGETSREKMMRLVRELSDTHLVFAKQGVALAPYEATVRAALGVSARRAPVELLLFPDDAWREIGPDGHVSPDCPGCDVIRIDPSPRRGDYS